MAMFQRLALVLLAGGLLGACATQTTEQRYDVDTTIEQVDGQFGDDAFITAASSFLGASVESVGVIIARLGSDFGEPDAFIVGSEGGAAIGPGVRYGSGVLVMRDGTRTDVYWQGPSVGWDVGANAARSFTLVYGLEDKDDIFRRFPGVEGSAYLVGGAGVNYQRAEGITLAPIRAGVGARLGANIGYLAYSRERNILPF